MFPLEVCEPGDSARNGIKKKSWFGVVIKVQKRKNIYILEAANPSNKAASNSYLNLAAMRTSKDIRVIHPALQSEQISAPRGTRRHGGKSHVLLPKKLDMPKK